MGERSAVAAREHGSLGPSDRGAFGVSDGVDTVKVADERMGAAAGGDRLTGQAKLAQSVDADQPTPVRSL